MIILRTKKGSALTYEEMDFNLTYLDTTKVNKTEDEIISGQKTFSVPIIGNLTGNADTATKLKTPRKINGVYFDGSSDITIPTDTFGGTVVTDQAQTFLGTKTFSNGLVGNLTGNADTATKLKTPRKINGVYFDGSSDITIPLDENNVCTLNTNQTISGIKTFSNYILCPSPPLTDNSTKLATTAFVKENIANTLSANFLNSSFVTLNTVQTLSALKTFDSGLETTMFQPDLNDSGTQVPNTEWVQNLLSSKIQPQSTNYKFTSGTIICNQSLTTLNANIEGYIPSNNNFNYGDIYPPIGYNMSNFVACIPSINMIWQSEGSDTNDVLYCMYYVLTDRIRIQCAVTEQRQASIVNYLCIWSK